MPPHLCPGFSCPPQQVTRPVSADRPARPRLGPAFLPRLAVHPLIRMVPNPSLVPGSAFLGEGHSLSVPGSQTRHPWSPTLWPSVVLVAIQRAKPPRLGHNAAKHPCPSGYEQGTPCSRMCVTRPRQRCSPPPARSGATSLGHRAPSQSRGHTGDSKVSLWVVT